MMHNSILEINDLSVHFGGLKAIASVNIAINEGGLIGLIGPNGAGKTTLFNAVTGLCRPTGGHIFFNNKDVVKKPAHYISRQGLARTFQNIRLFKSLTSLENLHIAYHQNLNYSIFSGIIKTKSFSQGERAAMDKAEEILSIVGLESFANEIAANLAYGNQRKLEIARALVTNPKLLLLDEPAAGMNPIETKELVNLIRKLRNELNITIFLIEHDMSVVMNLCEKIFVLDYGVLIAEGSASEIKSNEQVIKAYLGEDL